jgi:retron-type reverse transcriptase
VIVKVDIEDFFGTINSLMIKKALRKEKVPDGYIDEILNCCTLNDALPQGSPASPFLANLVFKDTDKRLGGLAGNFDAVYSRYADDLCFSSNNPELNLILPPLEWILHQAGFKVNKKKTRILRQGKRQIVTGVVVNKESNVPRELRRNTRARIFKLKMAALQDKVIDQNEYKSLYGLSSYIRGISPESGAKLSRSLKEIDSIMSVKQ